MTGSHNDVFDQNAIVEDIMNGLLQKSSARFVLLKGPSGSGKSHIAQLVANRWSNSTVAHMAFMLMGDIAQAERSYFPFIQFAGGQRTSRKIKVIVKGGSELAKGIPFAGDFISYLVDALSNNKSNRKKDLLKYLNETEQKLIFDIEKIIGQHEVIFVLDNIHWWDKDSLNLLRFFMDDTSTTVFPSFAKLSFLCLFTTDQPVVSQSGIQQILQDNRFIFYEVNSLKEKDYLNALQLFGYKASLSGSVTQMLFSITGSNLFLIKRLSEYLSLQSNKDEIEQLKDKYLSVEQKNSFLKELFLYRFKKGDSGLMNVFSVLEYAAVIGLTFNDHELLCITKGTEEELLSVIERAGESYLIETDQSVRRFSHDIIRDFFLSGLNERRKSYSKKFAECLSVLRPSEYFTRAHYLLEGGDIHDSTVLYIIGYFKNIREGLENRPIIEGIIRKNAEQIGILHSFDMINTAYNDFNHERYSLAIQRLQNLEDAYPKKIIAEKYYLLSLCISRPMENHLFREALNCLDQWDDLQTEEGELWLRIMSTKLTMYSHLYDFENAKSIEKRIMLYLAERIKFDKGASETLNIIRRKSGSLHISEIARDRSSASLDFFSRTDEQGMLLNPVQCYMSAANYSGNLISMAEFEQAFASAKLCIDLINDYGSIAFPKTFIPANNYIISGWMAGLFSPVEAIRMFADLFGNIGGQADHLLIKNNLAVAYCINEDMASARNMFTLLVDKVVRAVELDQYYVYFIISNWLCFKFINLEKENIVEEWDSLQEKIPQVPEAYYLRRRHELIRDSFLSMSNPSVHEWQNHLQEKFPNQLGPCWPFIGVGFLVTDLQFWSES